MEHRELGDVASQDKQLDMDASIVRLAAGLGLADLAVETSDCGQYVMLMCRGSILALIGAMGSDVESVQFANGQSYRVEDLMDTVSTLVTGRP